MPKVFEKFLFIGAFFSEERYNMISASFFKSTRNHVFVIMLCVLLVLMVRWPAGEKHKIDKSKDNSQFLIRLCTINRAKYIT